MPRGKAAQVGDTRVSPNGYHYTRTDNGWKLTHHLLAEEKVGRLLKKNERVFFKDNDRTNLDPDNLDVRIVNNQKEKRIRELEARIQTAQEELARLKASK